MRKTKIVCTLGPATDREGVLEDLIGSGMDCARLNFSHGSHEEHKKRLDAVRAATEKCGKTVAVMLDTKGPEIRIKQFESGDVLLSAGDSFTLYCGEYKGDSSGVAVTYKDLDKKVKPGDTILVDDGIINLNVVSAKDGKVETKVVVGGELKNNKSINIPGVDIPMPALTEKDKEDLSFGIENEVDFVAASFVRSADDIREIRSFLNSHGGSHIKIIAKIENDRGVKNIKEIVSCADGVMVARGDLGVEIPAEDVPLVQKRFIKMCNEAGKPVIVATQMLDSMIRNPRPTRAEVADVSNAVLDGADAVMLSGETAAGKYPVESVRTMARIAVASEEEFARSVYEFYGEETVTNMISFASCSCANRLNAKAIITPTSGGYTPRMVAKYRPHAVIVAVSVNKYVLRQLCLTRGVMPLEHMHMQDFESTVKESISVAVKHGYVSNGDLVVITSGLPTGEQTNTNTVRIETVS